MGSQLMWNLWLTVKLDKCEVAITYIKYTWISKQINWLCTCLYPGWPWCGCLHGAFFSNVSWWKQNRMVPKVKKWMYGLKQASSNRFDHLKTGLERMGYHQSQVDPCVFYIKDSVILTYVDDCVTVSHKQETIIS